MLKLLPVVVEIVLGLCPNAIPRVADVSLPGRPVSLAVSVDGMVENVLARQCGMKWSPPPFIREVDISPLLDEILANLVIA